jgi:hypothetical protein
MGEGNTSQAGEDEVQTGQEDDVIEAVNGDDIFI